MNENNTVLPKNGKGKDYIIGDLHGCFDLLEKALEKVNFDKEKDRLFSVGDVIDRGKDSFKCLRLNHEDWFYQVLGNHEYFLMDYLKGGTEKEVWERYGGKWFFDLSDEEKLECSTIAQSLPYTITVGDTGIVHACVPSADWNDVKELSENDMKTCLWTPAGNGYLFQVDNIGEVYIGHTIFASVRTSKNQNWIDTGAFMYNNLTIKEINKNG